MQYKMLRSDQIPALRALEISQIVFEVDEGFVMREVGLTESGRPCYRHPSVHNVDSFRGLFDVQRLPDDVGEAISEQQFEAAWRAAEREDQLGLLRTNL
jgi:hypothetical protein